METNNPNPDQPTTDQLHVQSVATYPKLNLSEHEYVLRHIRRHPIGKLTIWSEMSLLIILVLAAFIWYVANHAHLVTQTSHLPPVSVVSAMAAFLILLFVSIAIVATIIYNGNRIYLSNECIIQHVQRGLFTTTHEQLNLVKIEDVSVEQNGILPRILNYGTLSINTMDSRDSHILTLVRDPQEAADAIHNAADLAINRNPTANLASSGPATA